MEMKEYLSMPHKSIQELGAKPGSVLIASMQVEKTRVFEIFPHKASVGFSVIVPIIGIESQTRVYGQPIQWSNISPYFLAILTTENEIAKTIKS